MPTKNTTTKKVPVKKTRRAAIKAKPTKSKTRRSVIRRHVGLQAEEADFMTFRLTRQSLYWLVLGAVVVLFTLWILKLQMDIQAIYDQIDASVTLSN